LKPVVQQASQNNKQLIDLPRSHVEFGFWCSKGNHFFFVDLDSFAAIRSNSLSPTFSIGPSMSLALTLTCASAAALKYAVVNRMNVDDALEEVASQ